MMSDEELMLQFQGGSREAFEALFSRYQVPLYGFFFRRMLDRNRADDLTQETFLALIRHVKDWRPDSSLRAYIFGIAFRIAAAERRKQSRDTAPAHRTAASVEDPEGAVVVRLALSKLEPGECEILMLREYEQLSYSEIAEVLQIPVNTVRSRLFRARMAFKEILEPVKRDACK